MPSRFFLAASLVENQSVELSPEDSHHLSKVLRLQPGDPVIVFNGVGLWAEGTIGVAHARRSVVNLKKVHQESHPFSIQLAFGITKGAALEVILRRCTEIGIREFQPLITQHSLPGKGWNGERWEKILQEVAKQCECNFLPVLHSPLSLKEWIQRSEKSVPRVVCDESSRHASLPNLFGQPSVTLLIGPEGGWSEDERELFKATGSVFLGLGNNRLRAETAAIVGTVLLKQVLGEFR